MSKDRALPALRARWRATIAQETVDHPEIAEEIAKAYAGRRYWPRGMREWAASAAES